MDYSEKRAAEEYFKILTRLTKPLYCYTMTSKNHVRFQVNLAKYFKKSYHTKIINSKLIIKWYDNHVDLLYIHATGNIDCRYELCNPNSLDILTKDFINLLKCFKKFKDLLHRQ
jgi:hypothetical protein